MVGGIAMMFCNEKNGIDLFCNGGNNVSGSQCNSGRGGVGCTKIFNIN